MRFILLFALLFGFQSSLAQDDEDVLDEVEVQLEDEEEYEEEADDEVRAPPAPSNRFRTPSKRFGSPGASNRRGKSGGGEDRLGQTEGKVKFELVDPPKYYIKENRPYLKQQKK